MSAAPRRHRLRKRAASPHASCARADRALFPRAGAITASSMRERWPAGLRMEPASLYLPLPVEAGHPVRHPRPARLDDPGSTALRHAGDGGPNDDRGARTAGRPCASHPALPRGAGARKRSLSHSELRSLTTGPTLRRVIAKRRRIRARGPRPCSPPASRAGVFQVADVKLTAMAILTMCTGAWRRGFSEGGGALAPESIADRLRRDDLMQRRPGARKDLRS